MDYRRIVHYPGFVDLKVTVVMIDNFSIERVDRKQNDFIILVFIILLAGIGITMMFSASYYYGLKRFNDPNHFLTSQLISLCVGLALFFIAFKISLDLLRKSVPVVLFASLILTALTFLPGISEEVLGARRWLYIGPLSFQPSEAVKFALILYLASILSKKENRMGDFFNTVLPPLLIIAVFVALVYLQNDFSTAVFIFLSSFFMLFIAGVPIGYFLSLIVAAAPICVLLLFSKEHRVRRLVTFLDPASDPSGAGYQIIKAQQSLARGGLWGSGLGSGTAKLGGLPEVQSDFVFAVLGEESGFLGVVFVLALFLGFGIRGFMVAMRMKSKFKALLAFGITSSILYQALLNMAVVSGLVPATGIPLPFFSHGGTSLMVTLAMCGLLMNIANDKEDGPDE